MNLKDILQSHQDRLSLNDREFTEYLGLSRQWYTKFKAKPGEISTKTMYVFRDKLGITLAITRKHNLEILKQREIKKALGK